MKKDFSKIALETSLFKGRSRLLYLYIKSEKISHALVLLGRQTIGPSPLFVSVIERSANVPLGMLQLAAGETSEAVVSAEVFSVLTGLRLLATRGEVGEESVTILLAEYEQVLERLGEAGSPPPISIARSDLFVAEPGHEAPLPLPHSGAEVLALGQKDIHKGHYKGQKSGISTRSSEDVGVGDRGAKILSVIKGTEGISIKGISAVVRDCSEKTIQRELGTLIAEGLVVREGERRWSIYRVAPGTPKIA